MNCPLKYSKPSLRFKRWLRKGYAAFLSLGRVVTIGKLSSDIEGSSEGKTHSALRIAQNYTLSDAEDTAESMDMNTEAMAMSFCLVTPQGLNLSPKEYCYKPYGQYLKVCARTAFVTSFSPTRAKVSKRSDVFFYA
ncbi:MAG: hypothetical protein R3Y61_03070 [Rikenellaceae bacterium]